MSSDKPVEVAQSVAVPSAQAWSVVCLCAAWCGVCRQYEVEFRALQQQFPQVRFVWLDVEDEEELVGDLDVETFPTLLIAHLDRPMFLGRCCRKSRCWSACWPRCKRRRPLRQGCLPRRRRCGAALRRSWLESSWYLQRLTLRINALRLQYGIHDQTGGYSPPFFFGRLHLELEAAGKQLQDGYRVFCTSGIELNTWHYSKLLNKP